LMRRLLHRTPRLARATTTSREADWMARSAVPTEADEEARMRDEAARGTSAPIQ